MPEEAAVEQEAKSTEATDAKVEEIIKSIEGMTVLQLSKLVKALEDKFGVTAAAPVAVAGVAGGGAAAAAEEEEVKTEFDVVLKSPGAQKIQVIKVVRQLVSGLGLKEAKELVDSAPSTIKEGVTKEEADQIKEELEKAGAEVELK